MPKKKIEEYTLEELQKQGKTLQLLQFMLLGMMIVYGGVVIYFMAIGKGKIMMPFIAMPMALLAITFSLAAIRGSITQEIKKRSQDPN